MGVGCVVSALDHGKGVVSNSVPGKGKVTVSNGVCAEGNGTPGVGRVVTSNGTPDDVKGNARR